MELFQIWQRGDTNQLGPTNFNDMIKNVENDVRIDQPLQGFHYIIYGLISMKLSAGALEV